MNLFSSLNFLFMGYPKAGEKRLLDNTVQVTVIKSFPRSLTACLVEVPGHGFLLVKPSRLSSLRSA